MPIRIASAPVNWGIYEFEGIEPKYPYSQVLDDIVATGYTGLELGPWGYLPTDPSQLRQELQKRGLQLLSAFVPVRLVDASSHEAGVAEALKVGKLLAALGAKFVVLADDNGKIPELVQQAGKTKGSRLSQAQWDVFAAGVNRVAKAIHDELGLSVAFHHHGAGYVETPEEVRNLMQRTIPELVGLCLDTGHWHLGGGDAVEAIKEYGTRVRYLHLKDFDPKVQRQMVEKNLNYFQALEAGIYCELGKGEVDFPAVLKAMEQLGYDGWAVVEQDILSDDRDYPTQASRRNREYLRSLGY